MSVLFQCPDCRRLVEVEQARVTDNSVWLRCSACDAEASIARGNPASADDRIAIHKEVIRENIGLEDEAAPEAGSLKARVHALPTTDDERPVADRFEKLLERWDDVEAHEKAIKFAATSGHLATLGQRYRLVLDERPNDARAIAAQQRIVTAAMATMSPDSFTMAREKETGGSGKLIAFALIGLILVGGIFFVWFKYILGAG